MDPFDRERVVKILQDVSVELTEENDDDWINFLTDEIMQSTDDINSELSLNNVIGEHLSAITTPSKVSQYIHLIFSRLVDKEKHEEPEEVEILEDEDGEVLEDGSCLICERFMPLTKHHLVPRETHTWYKKHHGMTHVELHTGIMICRPCHSSIHKFIDNKTMAAEYNTLEKLLEHPKVQTWIPYIRKRKTTSKADKRTWVQNHRTDLPSYEDFV
eukprot:TRINITY_DN9094_c0_g1_i1.p1 TRINITY_DN9094_c0_g1~~TRINITY_DN9094_c0_g1_i1.p1  ORF type:complete len:215 (-),score=34.96 TRINITY_DN9094_c0_g1_i1:300-944(-)